MYYLNCKCGAQTRIQHRFTIQVKQGAKYANFHRATQCAACARTVSRGTTLPVYEEGGVSAHGTGAVAVGGSVHGNIITGN